MRPSWPDRWPDIGIPDVQLFLWRLDNVGRWPSPGARYGAGKLLPAENGQCILVPLWRTGLRTNPVTNAGNSACGSLRYLSSAILRWCRFRASVAQISCPCSEALEYITTLTPNSECIVIMPDGGWLTLSSGFIGNLNMHNRPVTGNKVTIAALLKLAVSGLCNNLYSC